MRVRPSLVLLAAVLLAACGQKGPLVRPGAHAAATPPAASGAEPAAEPAPPAAVPTAPPAPR